MTSTFSAAIGDGSGYGLSGNFETEMAQGRIHGLACAFYVNIDELDLGWWTNCTGLKVSWTLESIKEGGMAGNTASYAVRVKWDNVTLKRGMTRAGWEGVTGTGGVRGWLEKVIKDPTESSAASITLYDAWAQAVTTWNLVGVFPSSWSGPDFDADSKKVAYETLVLNHNGFLPHTLGDGA